jgi:hypothetical protein
MSSAIRRAVLERVGHVAIGDAQREAFGDRGLADAGFADQDRVVLGAAGEDLDGAADFLVAADDRIELAVARRLRQVAGEFLERVVAVLGAGVSAVRPPRSWLIARFSASASPAPWQRLARRRRGGERQCQQHSLDRDIAVARFGAICSA